MRTPVTLILPVKNEALSLGKLLDECAKVLGNDPDYEWRVMVVDNMSQDHSYDIAKHHKFCKVWLKCHPQGYGAALQNGLGFCNTELAIFFDADGSYDPCDAMRAVRKLNPACVCTMCRKDLVIGYRYLLRNGAMPWLHRYVGTPFLTWLLNLRHGTDITDVNGGLRAVRLSSYRTWGCKAPGFEFASEMIIKAHQAGAEIDEIAISYRKTPKGRESHIRTFRDGWRHFWTIMVVRR